MHIKYWTKEGHFEAYALPKVPYVQLHRTDGPAIEYSDGTREWWVNGLPHRVDGPAYEGASGAREWYLDGQLHRTDGPAIEYKDGSRRWCQNNKLHRIDGPAIERVNGPCEWFLFGHEVTEKEHKIDAAKGELYVKMRYG